MASMPKAQQDRLAKIARRHARPLMKKAGVIDVGIGYRYVDGEATGELAVVVRVAKKLPLSRLARKDRVPRTVSGAPTDVIEGVSTPLAGPHDRHDPLLGGIAVVCAGGGGTMGCVVFDRQTARPYGLTNQHVLVPDDPTTAQPWYVVQPKVTGVTSNLIGEYARADKATDSALFSLDLGSAGPRGLDTGILHTVSAPSRGSRLATIGMPVQKAGATTGVTYGVVTYRSFSSNGILISVDGNGPFADHGDSGAVVTERASGAVVGLLRGLVGDAKNMWAEAALIAAVLDAMDCFVFDQRDGVWTPPKAWIGGHHMAFTIVHPNEHATLSVRYPSGRISTADGLGRKRADRNGMIRWQWVVGTSTQRRVGRKAEVRLKVGDKTYRAEFGLDGTTRYDR